MVLKAEACMLEKDVAVLRSMDDNADKKFTHAWKIRDKDVSANPFIASTAKVRSLRALAEGQTGMVKVNDWGDSNTTALSDTSRQRRQVTTPPGGRIRATRRPSTSILQQTRSVEPTRPRSSPGPSASAWNFSQPKKNEDQYVHPTIYKLMTLERDILEEKMKAHNVALSATTISKQVPFQPSSKAVEHSLGQSYSEEEERAVVVLQRHWRGLLSRKKSQENRKKMDFMRSLMAFKDLKQSQLNKSYREAIKRDYVGESLNAEMKRAFSVVDAMFQKESQEAAQADTQSRKEFHELEQAQAAADLELQEANDAELRLERERHEMLSWKIKVDRAKALYEDTKAELNIEDDEDEEELRLHFPVALRDKKHYEGILKRYLKEKADYESSRATLEKESKEALAALDRCQRERIEWQEALTEALRERAQVEALALARKFTDPRVSVRERIRAFSGVEPEKFIKDSNTKTGKVRDETSLGVIKGDSHHSYAGEFCRVQEILIEDIRAAFNKHAVEGKLDVLKWENMGAKRPARGREIQNARLAEALKHKTEFTTEEWDAFGINAKEDLNIDDGISFIRSGSAYYAPSSKFLDVTSLISATRELGRRINEDESNRLVRAFDGSGDGGIQLEEFAYGLNNMVGMILPHGQGHELFSDGSSYVGEFYEDKRFGTGMYVSSKHHFYVGAWELGLRHGKGIEGRYNSKDRDAMLPVCVSTYTNGIRRKCERFNTKNPVHMHMFKDLLHICATSKKRASKARSLVAADVYRHDVRSKHLVQTTMADIQSLVDKEHEAASTSAGGPGNMIMLQKRERKGFSYLYGDDGAFNDELVDLSADVARNGASNGGSVPPRFGMRGRSQGIPRVRTPSAIMRDVFL